MKRILFTSGWLFHDGEIDPVRPALKGPVYTEAKTESYRNGPAAIHYDDRHNDFGRPGKVLTHEKWVPVTLPHDYIVNSPILESGNQALGFYEYRPAWYRKHFRANDEWKAGRVEIEFLGISTECEIFLNGVYLSSSRTAYTPITLDITDFIKYGEDNVIAVHVTQHTIENWWYNGGGITHKVYLNISDNVAVAKDGVYVHPTKIGDKLWDVPVEVEVRNDHYRSVFATVRTEILDQKGKVIAEEEGDIKIPARDASTIEFSLSVKNPKLWDIDSPNLYRARVGITCDGILTDEKICNFGFRTIEFTPNDGFILNGRRVNINGVCGHEDFGLTGKAVPDNVMRHKVRMLKEMGVNAYRCAHSMQDEAMMDAFDRYGILVMAETRHFSSSREHIAELKALVKRDRNRPSVFMWSIGNEEHYFISDEGRRIAEHMTFEVKRLDRTRPVMTANDKAPEQCTVYDISDLVAVNYNPTLYDYLHEKYPDKPFFVSECSAASTSRGWYFDDSPERGRRSAYDKDTNNWFQSHETVYSEIGKRPWIMGAFLWSAMEYLGEAVWPRLCSLSGAIDLYLQKKDSYYQMKSFFTKEPMVHILPHWNMEGMGSVRVVAYDNCDSVELFLGSKSLGKQKSKKYIHHEWKVPFKAGKLTCVGYDKKGNKICEDKVETTGPAVALMLRPENLDDVCFNGEDLLLFTCYAIDAKGREVPDAECYVSFMSDEGVKIVGTGSDNTDHTPPAWPERRMYNGRILLALLPIRAGELTLTAKANGLSPARITVKVAEDNNKIEGRVYPKYEIRG